MEKIKTAKVVKKLSKKDLKKFFDNFDDFRKMLSNFEKLVLDEFLDGTPYLEIHKKVSKLIGKKHKHHAVDCALLRIRKKAVEHRKKNENL